MLKYLAETLHTGRPFHHLSMHSTIIKTYYSEEERKSSQDCGKLMLAHRRSAQKNSKLLKNELKNS